MKSCTASLKFSAWRKTNNSLLALLFSLCAAGCGKRSAVPDNPAQLLRPEDISGERALAETAAFVALGPRDAGTAGAENAALHIARRLREIRLEPKIDEFTDNTPAGAATFRNVEAAVKGLSEKWIVLGCHYDTKRGIPPPFEGANDSGSGVGLLLEMARAAKMSEPTEFNLLFAFLDGEECMRSYGKNDGLHGSRRLAAELKRRGLHRRVRAVIILDMIGDANLTVTIPRNCTLTLVSAVFKAAEQEGVREKFGLHPNTITDDHVPFLDGGLAAVNLIDFDYGSVPGLHDYWHTPEDTMDKLSAESLQIVGRTTARLINLLAR